MLGLLIDEMEKKELEYLIKRELEELLFELGDTRIDSLAKQSMLGRYRKLFQLLLRVARKEDCLQYIPPRDVSK